MELLGSAQSKAQRHVFFAERQVWKIADVADDTPTLAGEEGRRHRRRHDGRRHLDEFPQRRHSRHHRRDRAGRARPGPGRHPQELREHRQEGPHERGRRRDPHGAPVADARSLRARRLRSHHRGGVTRIWRSRRRFSPSSTRSPSRARSWPPTRAISTSTRSRRPRRGRARCSGMHFFSPANVMRLLEVVRGGKTEKPVLATAMKVAKQIGKIGVVVGVCHGFVGNRMLGAAPARGAGADPRRRDALGRRPRALRFRLADGAVRDERSGRARHWLVEGEVVLLHHPRNPVRAGPARPEDGRGLLRLRREPQREALAAGREDHPRFRFAGKGINRRAISDQEILERCLYPLVNEGAKILEEGKAQRASDIDIVWINGYGWPVYTRRADVLGGRDRARQGARGDEGLRGEDGRRRSSLRRCWRSSSPRARASRTSEDGRLSRRRTARPSNSRPARRSGSAYSRRRAGSRYRRPTA